MRRNVAAARSREGADDKEVDALQSAVYERTLVLTDLIGENLYTPRGRDK